MKITSASLLSSSMAWASGDCEAGGAAGKRLARRSAQQKVRSDVPRTSPSETPNVLLNVGASSDTPTEVGDAPQCGGGGGHQNDSPSVLRQQRGKEAEDAIRRTEILIENHTRVSYAREGTPGTPMLVREAPQWRGVVQGLHGFFWAVHRLDIDAGERFVGRSMLASCTTDQRFQVGQYGITAKGCPRSSCA